MIVLPIFQQHLILYCKGHYKYENFFEGLKMIWAVRCGYDYEHCSSDIETYIANELYEIIAKVQPKRLTYIMEIIHKEVNCRGRFGKPEGMTPIQAIIWEYRSILSCLRVREKPQGKKRYQWIVKLPKPQKQVFNRILRGNGRYEDYELISK